MITLDWHVQFEMLQRCQRLDGMYKKLSCYFQTQELDISYLIFLSINHEMSDTEVEDLGVSQ